ncbi:MAG: TIGR02597 family protein [Verrucomicrobiia bacterium]
MQRANYARGLRFLPIVAFITTVGFISANAQSVYTDPVGFVTLTTIGNGLQYSGLPMTQVPVLRGTMGTITANQIPVNSTLTPGQYNENTQGAQYYIEDALSTIPASAGYSDDIVSNDANNVYTAVPMGSVFNYGDSFKIYPHWTLDSLFGTNNSVAAVAGAATASASDNIFVWNPVGQTSVEYWYRTSGSSPGWRTTVSTTTDAGQVPLYVDQGLEIQRKVTGPGGTNINFQVVGGVKLSNTVTVCPFVSPDGLAYVADMYATSVTPAALNLYTGNANTGVNGGATASAADNVFVWNPAGQTSVEYWYRTSGSSPGWRTTVSTTLDAGTNVIAIGSVLKIERKSSPEFTWTIPAQY